MQEAIAQDSNQPQRRSRYTPSAQLGTVPTRSTRSNHPIRLVPGGGGHNQMIEVESGWMDMATGKLIVDYSKPAMSLDECFEGYD